MRKHIPLPLLLFAVWIVSAIGLMARVEPTPTPVSPPGPLFNLPPDVEPEVAQAAEQATQEVQQAFGQMGQAFQQALQQAFQQAVAPAAVDAEPLPDAPIDMSSELISVSLDNVPLQDVVRLFTTVSAANIIAATTNLQGNVTANLQDVPWQSALASILDLQGLLLVEKPAGSNIFVIESRPPGVEPRVTETLLLKFARVEKIAELLKKMLGAEGAVVPFPEGNAILLQASRQKIAEARGVIELLDRPRSQVYIEARFVEMSTEASKQLGMKWDALKDWGVTLRDLRGHAEIDRGETESMLDESGTRTVSEAETWSDSRGASGWITASDFRLAMSAFEQMDGVSLISNPKIIVANEETAVVDMTTKEPYVKVTTTRNTAGGANTLDVATELGTIPGKDLFAGEAFFSYGVILEVTPRVSQAGIITVTIEPSLSEWLRDYTIGGIEFETPSTRYPIISMKRINTTFSMQDGATAVIGGLTRTGEINVDSGIPYLRSIPFIGPRLFGWRSRKKDQRELIIFVTVGIIDPEQPMDESIGMPQHAVLSRNFKGADDTTQEEEVPPLLKP